MTTGDPGLNPNLDFVYMGNRRVALLTGTVNPGPSPCFVATAAYGTAMSADIGALRVFRDKALKKISFGQKFIHWYYLKGPKYARWLQSHPGWKPLVRVGLVVPVAVCKVAFFGNVFVSLASFGLVLCGVVFVGRKRRWKTGRTLFVIFLLTFASVMIYSFIVEAPKAYASQTDAQLQQEKVYYFYEDHIGKPIAMSEYQDYDGDGNLYYRKTYDSNCQYTGTTHIWRTNFTPFGVDDYSFDSTGIDVGAGEDCHSTLEGWEPPFRFPGQYADPELLEDFVYNHWRFYMPEIGRYTSPDPLGIITMGSKLNIKYNHLYNYAINDPVLYFDLGSLRPQRVVNKPDKAGDLFNDPYLLGCECPKWGDLGLNFVRVSRYCCEDYPLNRGRDVRDPRCDPYFLLYRRDNGLTYEEFLKKHPLWSRGWNEWGGGVRDMGPRITH